MRLLKDIIRLFFSLKTTLWLLILLLLLFLAGAVFMPVNDAYRGMSSVPLFEWLQHEPLKITWWVWCSIGMLLLLAINTILCSVESLMKKGKVKGWLLLIAPQIIHIGFLLVLFAHLLDADRGFKYLSVVRTGTILRIDDNKVIRIEDIDVNIDASGYIRDWKVGVEYLSNNRIREDGIMRPNRPLIKDGFNVIVKDLKVFPYKAVHLQISREPGASWAFGGGLLIIAGIVILILFKIRVER
jgi:hypothetical protein